MSSVHIDDVTVVVRSVGERTEAACYHLLAQQVPKQNIVVIHEQPFAAAVAKSYEVGIERKQPWTLCIDADVLVRDGIVRLLLEYTETVGKDTFEIQGKVLDKCYGGPMSAGNHLYRTSLLKQALRHVPFDNRSMRPETYAIKEMAKLGFPWLQIEDVVGLHGYEQYYRDIYRTMFVRACKQSSHKDYWANYFQEQLAEDEDLRVALWGLRAGLIYDGPLSIDAGVFPEEIDVLLHVAGLTEKEPLVVEDVAERPDRIIAEYQPPPEYLELQALVEQRARDQRQREQIVPRRRKLYLRARQLGPIRLLPWMGGRLLSEIGSLMQRWAEESGPPVGIVKRFSEQNELDST